MNFHPSQRQASILVAITQPDLPQDRSCIWPKEIAPKRMAAVMNCSSMVLGSKAPVMPSRPLVDGVPNAIAHAYMPASRQAEHSGFALTNHWRSCHEPLLVTSTHLRNSSNAAMASSDSQTVCGVNTPQHPQPATGLKPSVRAGVPVRIHQPRCLVADSPAPRPRMEKPAIHPSSSPAKARDSLSG